MIHRVMLISLLFVLNVEAQTVQPAASDEPETRGFLGFQFSHRGDALEVVRLYPEGPAMRVGMRPGDRIVAVNGVGFRFTSETELSRAFDWVEPRERIELTVEREGTEQRIELVASEMPDLIARQKREARETSVMIDGNEALRRFFREGGDLIVEKLEDGSFQVRNDADASAPIEGLAETLGRRFPFFRRHAEAMRSGERHRFRMSPGKSPGSFSLTLIRPGGRSPEPG